MRRVKCKVGKKQVCRLNGGPFHGEQLWLTTSGTLSFRVKVGDISYRGRYDRNNRWVDEA